MFSGSGSRDAYNEQHCVLGEIITGNEISVLITSLGSDGSGESAQTHQRLRCLYIKRMDADEDPDQK